MYVYTVCCEVGYKYGDKMLVIFSQLYICVWIYTPFYLQYIIVVIALVQDFQGGGGVWRRRNDCGGNKGR